MTNKFAEAEDQFDWQRLIKALTDQKGDKLRPKAQEYLKAVLCGYDLQKIAETCYVRKKSVEIELSREVKPYLHQILNIPEERRVSWIRVPRLLEDAGFKQSDKPFYSFTPSTYNKETWSGRELLIAGEMLGEPFRGDVKYYWQHYQSDLAAISQERSQLGRPTVRSRRLEHQVRKRVRQSLERLPDLARRMLCGSSVYRRPVIVAFWEVMLGELPNSQKETAFATLQDRYLVEWEGVMVRQHNLIRNAAHELLKVDQVVWKNSEYAAVQMWRTAYKPEANAPNLEKVRGSLEAFHHLCEVEDWGKASELFMQPLNPPSRSELYWLLFGATIKSN